MKKALFRVSSGCNVTHGAIIPAGSPGKNMLKMFVYRNQANVTSGAATHDYFLSGLIC